MNYHIYPFVGSTDLFFQKERVYSSKPKIFSFKLFLDNQLQSFENFYLKNEIFIADSFEYLEPKDENFEYFFNAKYTNQRIEDWKHYYRVRMASDTDEAKEESQRLAEMEAKKFYKKDDAFIKNFQLSSNFFRKSSSKKYHGFGEFFFKGRKLPMGIFFNKQNYNDFSLKDNFLFNFIFGFFRDRDS